MFVTRGLLHGELVHILQVPAALLLSVTTPEHLLSLRVCLGMTVLCVQDPPSVLAVLYQNRISFPFTNFSHTSGSTESASIISIVQWLRKQILRLGCMGPNSSQPPFKLCGAGKFLSLFKSRFQVGMMTVPTSHV